MKNTKILVVGLIGILSGILISNIIFQPINYMKDLSIPPPKFLFDLSLSIYILFVKINDYLSPPHHLVVQDMYGVYRTQIAYTIVRLNLADIIGDSSKTINELVQLTKVEDEDVLQRFLRAAESIGYFTENIQLNSWKNTAKSSILRTDHPNSLYSSMYDFVDAHMSSISRLYESILTGKSQFAHTHNGAGIWEYFSKNPDKEKMFAMSMSNLNKIGVYSQVHDYDWNKYDRMVDIAGSLGSFLLENFNVYPKLKGHLFDLDSVIEKAKTYWLNEHSHYIESKRISFSSGSFLNSSSLPSIYNNDVIVMKNILHDWSDSKALEILKNLRSAIGEVNATLALIELCIDEKDLWPNYFLDLHMHILVDGKERSVDIWRKLFQQSGFYLENIIKTRSFHKIILVKPKSN